MWWIAGMALRSAGFTADIPLTTLKSTLLRTTTPITTPITAT